VAPEAYHRRAEHVQFQI